MIGWWPQLEAPRENIAERPEGCVVLALKSLAVGECDGVLGTESSIWCGSLELVVGEVGEARCGVEKFKVGSIESITIPQSELQHT